MSSIRPPGAPTPSGPALRPQTAPQTNPQTNHKPNHKPNPLSSRPKRSAAEGPAFPATAPWLLLIAAILSRFFPYALHGIGLNVTALPAALLFFGARRPLRELPLAAALLALADAALTTLLFHLPFHPADYAVTWAWYLAAPLLGRTLLRQDAAASPTRRLPRLVLAVAASALSFFLLSNGVVWLQTGLYPHTTAGLLSCYAAGLPFLRNDLLSTLVCTAAVFELPTLARTLAPLHHTQRT